MFSFITNLGFYDNSKLKEKKQFHKKIILLKRPKKNNAAFSDLKIQNNDFNITKHYFGNINKDTFGIVTKHFSYPRKQCKNPIPFKGFKNKRLLELSASHPKILSSKFLPLPLENLFCKKPLFPSGSQINIKKMGNQTAKSSSLNSFLYANNKLNIEYLNKKSFSQLCSPRAPRLQKTKGIQCNYEELEQERKSNSLLCDKIEMNKAKSPNQFIISHYNNKKAENSMWKYQEIQTPSENTSFSEEMRRTFKLEF